MWRILEAIGLAGAVLFALWVCLLGITVIVTCIHDFGWTWIIN